MSRADGAWREKVPKHGDIVTERIPTDYQVQRRRWCGTCGVWTWERWPLGSGVFVHGRGRRKRECKP
jgi:hypothetical protein